MKLVRFLLIAVTALSIGACAGMSQTQQRTVTGGAIGAGGGAVIGGLAGGHPAVGAVLGGAAGALTGYILGERQDPRHHRSY